jgi:hypothetical protein
MLTGIGNRRVDEEALQQGRRLFSEDADQCGSVGALIGMRCGRSVWRRRYNTRVRELEVRVQERTVELSIGQCGSAGGNCGAQTHGAEAARE